MSVIAELLLKTEIAIACFAKGEPSYLYYFSHSNLAEAVFLSIIIYNFRYIRLDYIPSLLIVLDACITTLECRCSVKITRFSLLRTLNEKFDLEVFKVNVA